MSELQFLGMLQIAASSVFSFA